jgi:hypothetical protein
MGYQRDTSCHLLCVCKHVTSQIKCTAVLHEIYLPVTQNHTIWMMAKYLFELFLLGSRPVSLALLAAGIVHAALHKRNRQHDVSTHLATCLIGS